MYKWQEKIKTLSGLEEIIRLNKLQKKRVVHCHGVFDLLHIGHIKHLEAARKLGDLLVVTVTQDKYVNKGPHRPAFPDLLRAEALAALSHVDYVSINEWPSAVNTIEMLKPDVYVKGVVHTDGKRDHSDAFALEERAVKGVGGELVLTNEDTFSASTLINRFIDVFTPEAKSYLEMFREKYTPESLIGHIESIRPLKVLTIGETIIDEYRFCHALGKASKEPVLAVRSMYEEKYAGGILAVANHTANFCDEVGLISFLGESDSQESFVISNLSSNVDPFFINKPDSPTIVKRRFVEEYLGVKLFEVYEMNNDQFCPALERDFMDTLEERLDDYDVVVVTDYGHGLLTDGPIELLCEKAKFLAVNTQTNAGNMGYNMISKYSRVDYISVAEPELRLDNRKIDSDLSGLVLRTAEKTQCGKIIVTSGKKGSLCYDSDTGFIKVPAFSVKVVDRIGAGDALLSLTAPCVAAGVPIEVAGFVGNVAGAEACLTMGNKSSVESSSLFRHITSLLS